MSDKYKEAAKVRGEARSAAVELKVNMAMKAIEAEIQINGGVYPQNGGAVSKNEVARRAGINLTTLFSSKQKELGEQVSLWLTTLKKMETVGRMRLRRTYAERAEDWKARYECLKNSHIKTELDLQQAEAEREEVLAEVQRLRLQNEYLLDQLSAAGKSKVIQIPKMRDE
jgi:hypothetical protein